MHEADEARPEETRVLGSDGFAGHALVAVALTVVSFVLCRPLPHLALMVAVVTLVMVLVGRREFRQNPRLKGAGLAVAALIGSIVILVLTAIPWVLPLIVMRG